MRPSNQPGAINQALVSIVLDWLVNDWHFLGFNGQVWMPLMAAALAAYIAALIILRRRHTGSR